MSNKDVWNAANRILEAEQHEERKKAAAQAAEKAPDFPKDYDVAPADPPGPAAGETGPTAAPSENAAPAPAPASKPEDTPAPAPSGGKAPSLEDIRAKGIEAAKIRGVRFGRPEKPLPENFEEIRGRWAAKEISGKEAARQCNMPSTSFYRKAGYRKEE